MKIVLILTLSVVCTNVFAQQQQQGGGQWQDFPIQIQPKPQPKPALPTKVIACMDTLRSVINNISDWDLESRCRVDKTQDDVRNKIFEIQSCLETSKKYSRSFWAINCLEETYRQKYANKNYTDCLSVIRPTILGNSDDPFCQDESLRPLANDPSLISCVSFFEKDLSRAYGWGAITMCKDKAVRDNVNNKTYRDCHQELKKHSLQLQESMDYCGQPQAMIIQGLNHLKSCITDMNKIFSAPKGTEICIRNIYNPEITSNETIACMNQTIRSASPRFLDVLGATEAAQFMSDLTLDCKKSSIPYSNQGLRYLGTYFVGSSERVNNNEIGGLSSLVWDGKSQTLLALSDQRYQGKNYIFKFDIKDTGAGFDVTPEDKILAIKPEFDPKDGKGVFRFDIDSEGMVLEPTGNIIVSSESLKDNDRSYVKVFTSLGKQIEAIELPQKFYNFKLEQVTFNEQPRKQDGYWQNGVWNSNNTNDNNYGNNNDNYYGNTNDTNGSVRVQRGNGNSNVTCYGQCGDQPIAFNIAAQKDGPQQQDDHGQGVAPKTRTYTQRSLLDDQGVTENKGFEALGITRDGKSLFTANEAPLKQDILKDEKIIRILKLERSPTFKPVAEYLYKLENVVENGLVEILPINSEEILTLERSYDSQLRKNTVRIFKVNLRGAVDSSANDSLNKKGYKIQTVKKDLVIDLDKVIDSMPAGLRKLDNIEGITFGPKTASGNDTILLVSDNNMSTKQRTLFMSFEILR